MHELMNGDLATATIPTREDIFLPRSTKALLVWVVGMIEFDPFGSLLEASVSLFSLLPVDWPHSGSFETDD